MCLWSIIIINSEIVVSKNLLSVCIENHLSLTLRLRWVCDRRMKPVNVLRRTLVIISSLNSGNFDSYASVTWFVQLCKEQTFISFWPNNVPFRIFFASILRFSKDFESRTEFSCLDLLFRVFFWEESEHHHVEISQKRLDFTNQNA